MKIKDVCSLEGKLWQTKTAFKKQRQHIADTGPYIWSYGFSRRHAWMWELDHKEGWAPKNRCCQTVVLEKTIQSCIDSKEIKLVNPKGNQPWIPIGRTNAEAEVPILRSLDLKSQLIGKNPEVGNDWKLKEKGAADDEMIGWHRLNGHEFEQTPGDSGGQRSLVSCSPWGLKESDTD